MTISNKTVTLTQKNVEDLVFYNQELKNKLPDFLETFQTWQLGVRIPTLRPSAQKAVLDFLNKVSEKHIVVMKEYFKADVLIEKLDYSLVHNYQMSIYDAEDELNHRSDSHTNFFIYRKDEQLYISFWR